MFSPSMTTSPMEAHIADLPLIAVFSLIAPQMVGAQVLACTLGACALKGQGLTDWKEAVRGVAKNVALIGVQGLLALAHHLHRPKPGRQGSLDVLVDPQLRPGPLPPACSQAASTYTPVNSLWPTSLYQRPLNNHQMHAAAQPQVLSDTSEAAMCRGSCLVHRLSDRIAGQVGSKSHIFCQAAGRRGFQ